MAARKQCLWHFIVLPLASQRITPPFALSSLANGESYLRSQGLVVIRTISTTHSLLFLKKSSAAAAASALALSLMPTAAATLLFSFSFPFSFSFTFSLCIAKNAVACFAFFSPSSFFSSVLLSRLSYWLKGLKGKKRDKCFVLLWNERSNKSSVRLSCLSSFIVRRSVCQINS